MTKWFLNSSRWRNIREQPERISKRSNKLGIDDCGAVCLNSRDNYFQPRFLYPAKLLIKYDGTEEKFLYMNAFRTCMSPTSFLKNLSK